MCVTHWTSVVWCVLSVVLAPLELGSAILAVYSVSTVGN